MTRRIPAILLGLAAAAAFAAPAGAVSIPREHAQFSSARILNGQLVWFQRNNRYKSRKHKDPIVKAGVGGLYARALSSKRVERVYLPPTGQKIVSFRTGGGRIVVGLATISKSGRGPSEVVELTPGPAPWAARQIVSDPDVTDANICRSRVELIGVQPDGRVIVQRDRIEGRGADCALARQAGELIAFAKDGTTTTLTSRKSGWANAALWSLLPMIQPTESDWLIQFTPSGWGWGYGVPVSVLNSATGDAKTYPSASNVVTRAETLSSGAVLLSTGWYEAQLLPSPADPTVTRTLWRSENEDWFHACGDQILEIARSWWRPHQGKWRMYLRNNSGMTTTRLDEKLAPGTIFDACDATTAVFHRIRRDGSAHQWTVRLGD